MALNKKQISFVMLGMFLLFGMVTAGIVGLNSKNIKVSTNSSTIINAINTEKIERGDIICDERTCSQKMWKGDYKLGTVTISRYKCERYSEPEGEDLLNRTWTSICLSEKEIKDDKIKEEISKRQAKKLEEIAKVIEKRAEKEITKKEIIDKGEIILTN